MRSNKYFLWIAVSLLSGAFCTLSALAEAPRPDAYEKLTAVKLAPSQTPHLTHGFNNLAGNERRYQERLPMQLEGAIQKVKAAKYKPQRKHKRNHPRKSKAHTTRS